MRQLWIAGAILAGMLLLLSWNGAYLTAFVQPMEEALEQTVEAVGEEDWGRAEALSAQVLTRWKAALPYLRLVQSHANLDEVTTLLEEAQAHLRDRNAGDHAAFRARTLQKLAAIRGLEQLSLGNLL